MNEPKLSNIFIVGFPEGSKEYAINAIANETIYGMGVFCNDGLPERLTIEITDRDRPEIPFLGTPEERAAKQDDSLDPPTYVDFEIDTSDPKTLYDFPVISAEVKDIEVIIHLQGGHDIMVTWPEDYFNAELYLKSDGDIHEMKDDRLLGITAEKVEDGFNTWTTIEFEGLEGCHTFKYLGNGCSPRIIRRVPIDPEVVRMYNKLRRSGISSFIPSPTEDPQWKRKAAEGIESLKALLKL